MSAKPGPGQPGESKAAVVFFAVKEEASPFKRFAASHPEVTVVVTGMGTANARRRALETLAVTRPELVLTCGFAGGLDPSLRTGDVVYDTDSDELAVGLLNAGARRASFLCASRVAVSAAEKLELRRRSGKDVVEMESEVIRAVATEQRIASATLRVILDMAEEDLPLDFNLLVDADQNLQASKLALAIAKAPQRIPGLIRFGRKSRVAAVRLARVLERVLEGQTHSLTR